MGVDALIEQLARMVPPCPRQQKGPFLFAVDHCFALRGQGTVLTGTVLSGAVQVRLLIMKLKGCEVQANVCCYFSIPASSKAQ